MGTVKITAVGDSAGIILPQELLKHLRVSEGDTLHVSETPNGIELSVHNPEVARQMRIAESVMREREEVLRRLAE